MQQIERGKILNIEIIEGTPLHPYPLPSLSFNISIISINIV